MHREHLSKDARMKNMISTLPEKILERKNKVYLRLCSSILSQQLNVKVARILYERFLKLYNGKEPTLKQILNTSQKDFQGIGFSKAKSAYVHNVCIFFIENKITDKQLFAMENEEVIELLTQIKGIGKWTVEMILMFTLGREDVFPIDDLGIRNAMIGLYNIKETDKKKLNKKLLKISGKWSPYRTYASMYLWQWKDGGEI